MRNGTCIAFTLLLFLLGCSQPSLRQTAVSPPPSSPTPIPTPTIPTALLGDEPVVTHFPSPAYGIYAFLWWRGRQTAQDLKLVQDMGFGWVKQEFPWREIEGIKKGEFDWWRPDLIVQEAEAAGLDLIVRLDRQPFWAQVDPSDPEPSEPPANFQDFADFCGATAVRYKGRIKAYQVWNEPNLSREWAKRAPDPAEYTELLRVCYEAIKTADPDAIVISAGLAPTGTPPPEAMPDMDFLQGMYDAGAANYFDVLGLHAPGFKAPPEVSPDEVATSELYGNGRWFAFRHVEDMRGIMVANGDGRKQVAILEMGWTLDTVNPVYAWFAVDEQTQADYLVRAYQYAAENWQPWIGLMTAVYIADQSWTAEHEQWWWSIVLPDGTLRPAYHALSQLEK